MMKLKPADPDTLAALLDAAAYGKLTECICFEEGSQEAKNKAWSMRN